MADKTALDHAHMDMQSAPDDEAARLRYYARLADCELFVLLQQDAVGDQIEPQVIEVTGGPVVLAFDREERLTGFAGGAAPYAALSGRALAGMLAKAGLGLALNLGIPASETVLPAAALHWLTDTLAQSPDRIEAGLTEIAPPGDLPEALLQALDTKLATAGGLAEGAYLASVRYREGGQGHLLGFLDAVEGAEPALAAATREALVFSGMDAACLDVGFFRASDPIAAKLAAVALRFDLPTVEVEPRGAPTPPGSDPDKPPILRH